MMSRLDDRLSELKNQVNLKGFRKGKVPIAHLKRIYGRQAMAEIVNDLINSRTGEVLVERGERAAQKPDIAMTEDEKEADAILSGVADFEFTVAYEVLPEFPAPDIESIEIDRPVAEATAEIVDAQVLQVAESARSYAPRDGAAQKGDRLTIDYAGSIDGEAFEGGTDTDTQLVLGSGRFIPGFEEQLEGAAAGEDRKVTVTFPEDYQAEHLAGKEAVFDVTVKLVEAPGELTIDDELARQLGVESADKLREAVRGQIESRYGSFTRARVKRQVLDKLDAMTSFELPAKMVEQEFENIWGQVTVELERAGKTFEDEETTEEKAREEYRTLAERRVRLGLVLADIGEKADVQVTEDELQRAVYDQVRRFPGQEQQVFNYFREHPDAVAGLRAPLYEDKVVDLIVSRAKVTDRVVSAEELEKDDEQDEA